MTWRPHWRSQTGPPLHGHMDTGPHTPGAVLRERFCTPTSGAEEKLRRSTDIMDDVGTWHDAGVVLLCMCVGCCRLPMPARTTVTAESGAVPPGARVYVPVDRPRSSKPASSTMEEGEEWDPSPRLDLSKERGPMRSSFARALLGQAPPAGAPLPPEKLRQSWFDILSV